MLLGLTLPQLALLMGLGLLLDAWFGEARRWHPLVGFGRWANRLEKSLNRGQFALGAGALAWACAVLPFVALAYGLCTLQITHSAWSVLGLHALLLYAALGLRSLYDHTAPIAAALQAHDLATARLRTSYIVSRDTTQANEGDLAKATVESLLENGNDAVFGTLFWFIVGGGPGVVLFRLANTLDAMWGYRNTRFERFGKVAARIDDALNYCPARLTALSYALLGHTRTALVCWRSQVAKWPSPNAGPVMAAGAGALQLALGGSATYDGIVEQRPPLGLGTAAQGADISRAWRMVWRVAVLWWAVVVCAALVQWSVLKI